jgi:hypothetical protein
MSLTDVGLPQGLPRLRRIGRPGHKFEKNRVVLRVRGNTEKNIGADFANTPIL